MSILIRLGAASEPITRANDCTKRVHEWLKPLLVKAPDFWAVVDGIARHFHPDYLVDQKTRHLQDRVAGGAFVYFQMERGEFKPATIKELAPTLFKALPSKPRGIPAEYHYHVAITAACLVLHVHENLRELMDANAHSDTDIFRHLYWHQRFFLLWEKTLATKPPNLNINLDKKRVAATWQDDFRSYYAAQKGTGKKLRSIASAFAAKKKQKPSFDTVYRWALKNRDSL